MRALQTNINVMCPTNEISSIWQFDEVCVRDFLVRKYATWTLYSSRGFANVSLKIKKDGEFVWRFRSNI